MTTSHRYYELLNTASRLPTHILRTMFVLAALAGTGLTLGALTLEMQAGPALQLAPATTATQHTAARQSEAAPVTLPTVTVRASDSTAAARGGSGSLSRQSAAAVSTGRLVRRAAGAALVMPYYSFAQPMGASIEE